MLVTQEKSRTKRFKDLIPLDVFKSKGWTGEWHIFIRCDNDGSTHKNCAICVTDNEKVVAFAPYEDVTLLTATLTWEINNESQEKQRFV